MPRSSSALILNSCIANSAGSSPESDFVLRHSRTRSVSLTTAFGSDDHQLKSPATRSLSELDLRDPQVPKKNNSTSTKPPTTPKPANVKENGEQEVGRPRLSRTVERLLLSSSGLGEADEEGTDAYCKWMIKANPGNSLTLKLCQVLERG
ncbi:unnamed protein product [Ilex paraguariensis]|uniref:Uncharacterized protein n=1 Tax=Ilex paraguariensis TaxID=185542 RepID=A0ABC8TS82_9AQUA